MTKKTRLLNAVLACMTLALLGGADGDCGKRPPIIDNNGFDLWCGDTLCYWSLDKGMVAPAPTWHSEDFAVDLIGDAVALSQLSTITNSDYRCIEFSLLANIESTATVHLEMDIYDDGIVDWRQPIPASKWAPFSYLVLLPARYEGIRFRLTKVGSGRALLAQIVAESGAGKCNMPAIVIDQQPDGAACSSAANCASNVCSDSQFPAAAPGVCGGCTVGGDECDFDEICGSATPSQTFLDLYQSCDAPFRHQLGERCVTNNECASATCANGVCSTCETSADCDVGEICGAGQRFIDQQFLLAPRQCDPQTGGTGSGDECLVDSDCDSGRCSGGGTMRVCELDGRRCSGDSDCPGDLQCSTIGTDGARCD